MLCDRCFKNKACSYKCVFENGKKVFKHLCASCANEAESAGFKEAKVGEKFLAKDETKKQNQVCPVCFSSLASILKHGRLGCSMCYSLFGAQLEESIKKSQDGLVHKGKKYASK